MKFLSNRGARSRLMAVAGAVVATIGAIAALGTGSAVAGGGHTFVAAVPAIPSSLDAADFNGGTRPFFTLLNSSLFAYNDPSCNVSANANNLVGVLAKSWKLNKGGKSYTITLNSYKSAYGNPLTSEDIKWSLDRGLALSPIVKFLSSGNAHYNIKNPITIINAHTFKLNLVSTTPVDLANLAIPTYTIYDAVQAKKHATKKDPWATKWLTSHSDGFGPWQVTSYSANNEVVMTPNPGYTGHRGNITKLILKQIPNPADQAELLHSGQINYAGSLTWSEYASLAKSKNVTVYPCAGFSTDELLLQEKYAPLANVKVRQAISMAINRSALVKGAYAGYGTPALTPFYPGLAPGIKQPKLSENLSEAKTLMSQAGYGSGFTLQVDYNTVQPGSEVIQDAILLQSQLAQIGITVQLNQLASGNDETTDWETGNYQALIYSTSPALPALYFSASLQEPGAPADSFGYKDPLYVTDMNKLGAAIPGTKGYNAAVAALAKVFVTDMPAINLVNTPNIFAMTSNVTNIKGGLDTSPIIPDAAQLDMK